VQGISPDLIGRPLLSGPRVSQRHIFNPTNTVCGHIPQKHGSIGLTETKAFKRVFVHWAVENFDWPGKSAEEMFRYHEVDQ
jgi:hypothetical protein